MAWKIAYPTPLYFGEDSCLGGGERYPTYLASGVVEATGGAMEVEILSYGVRPRRELLAPGVSLRVLEAEPTDDPLNALSWELPEAIEDADLVHIHQIYLRSSMMALLAAKQQGKPVCMTDHGARGLALGVESVALELADRIIAYSEFGGAQFQTKTPIVVVKGGVDTTYFTPPSDPSPRDFVLYVGRLLPHKGIDQLIDALPNDLPLIICGRPTHDDYFARLKAASSGKHVQFVTDADDDHIRDLYRKALVNVLPSVTRDCYGTAYVVPELMGLTNLEANACGTPSIASNVAALPEFIDDGETGYVFKDIADLNRILQRLASDKPLADRLGKRARDVVVREYDHKVVGAKMARVYASLIEPCAAETEVAA